MEHSDLTRNEENIERIQGLRGESIEPTSSKDQPNPHINHLHLKHETEAPKSNQNKGKKSKTLRSRLGSLRGKSKSIPRLFNRSKLKRNTLKSDITTPTQPTPDFKNTSTLSLISVSLFKTSRKHSRSRESELHLSDIEVLDAEEQAEQLLPPEAKKAAPKQLFLTTVRKENQEEMAKVHDVPSKLRRIRHGGEPHVVSNAFDSENNIFSE